MSDASLISAVVIAIVAYMYFTIIRPARKDQAFHRQQIRDLRTGDRVLTTSNFIATVKDIQVTEGGPATILLEMADGVVFTALAGAILKRVDDATENAPASDDVAGSAVDPSTGSGRTDEGLAQGTTGARRAERGQAPR